MGDFSLFIPYPNVALQTKAQALGTAAGACPVGGQGREDGRSTECSNTAFTHFLPLMFPQLSLISNKMGHGESLLVVEEWVRLDYHQSLPWSEEKGETCPHFPAPLISPPSQEKTPLLHTAVARPDNSRCRSL